MVTCDRPRHNRLEADGRAHTATHGRHVTWLPIVYKVGHSLAICTDPLPLRTTMASTQWRITIMSPAADGVADRRKTLLQANGERLNNKVSHNE